MEKQNEEDSSVIYYISHFNFHLFSSNINLFEKNKEKYAPQVSFFYFLVVVVVETNFSRFCCQIEMKDSEKKKINYAK